MKCLISYDEPSQSIVSTANSVVIENIESATIFYKKTIENLSIEQKVILKPENIQPQQTSKLATEIQRF